MILLPEEERIYLINSKIVSNISSSIFNSKNLDLKDRYKDTFAEYQRLPLRIETTSNIVKQTHLTNELVNLERDINFLEKYSRIFIANPCSQVSN